MDYHFVKNFMGLGFIVDWEDYKKNFKGRFNPSLYSTTSYFFRGCGDELERFKIVFAKSTYMSCKKSELMKRKSDSVTIVEEDFALARTFSTQMEKMKKDFPTQKILFYHISTAYCKI